MGSSKINDNFCGSLPKINKRSEECGEGKRKNFDIFEITP